MFKNRTDYIHSLFCIETDLQKSIRENTADNISIHPEEGRLLQTLVGLGGIQKIVEIGTFAGYSTLWLANALPANGHIWTIEKDDRRFAHAQKNLSGIDKITALHGDALQTLQTITPYGPFDMVFIDADKLNYEHYLDWAEKNVRCGGLIVGDNTFLFDAAWKDGDIERVRETARNAMRNFNKRLADVNKYTSIMLDTPEGMTIAVKNF